MRPTYTYTFSHTHIYADIHLSTHTHIKSICKQTLQKSGKILPWTNFSDHFISQIGFTLLFPQLNGEIRSRIGLWEHSQWSRQQNYWLKIIILFSLLSFCPSYVRPFTLKHILLPNFNVLIITHTQKKKYNFLGKRMVI